MALIDSNILIYSTTAASPFHAKARKFMAGFLEGDETWNLTWQNIFEYIRVTTDPRQIPPRSLYIDQALTAVRQLLLSPSLQLIHPGPRHFEIFSDVASHTPGVRGILIHDARLVAIMIENGVREIYTNDEGFRRFRDIQVINPLA